MRFKNSFINIIFGLGGHFVITGVQFLVRTVFIFQLGKAYLGVNGLFTNVLSILSLAELGIGNAIIYSLYKPLAEKDNNKVKALMGLYEKAYRIIAAVILVLGLMLIPFLKYIIKDPPQIPENIILIYLLFLINSVTSYLFVYKTSLIIADQKQYIVTIITNLFSVLGAIGQISMLFFTRSFIGFLVTQIFFVITNNIYLVYKANKMYPILKEKQNIQLEKEEKANIFKNVRALIIYKIGALFTIGLDNILISSFIGIVWVGIYSNYTMLTGKIHKILSQIFSALTASVGNLNAGDDINKKEFIYKTLLFIAFWLYGFCSICLYMLLNPFIELWVGREYLLTNITTLIIVLNFYFLGMHDPTMIFRNTLGLYVQGRYRPLIGAFINIIISMALIGRYGILGVVLGTLFSRVLVLAWYEPFIIYKNAFNKSVIKFYVKYIFYTITVIVTAIVCSLFSNYLDGILALNKINQFVTKLTICLVIPNMFFLIIYWNVKEFQYLKSNTQVMISKIKNRAVKI